jgi:hypothetical protein
MTQSEDYSSYKGISQSMLKAWRFKSPAKWKAIYFDNIHEDEKETESLVFGSLLDIMLFTPDKFDKKFFVSEMPKLPSPALKWILEETYARIHRQYELVDVDNMPPSFIRDFSLDSNRELVLQVAAEYRDGEKTGWYSNLNPNTRFDKINAEFDYYHLLVLTGDRKIISKTMHEEAKEQMAILCADECTKPYFIQEEGETLLHQFEIMTDREFQSGDVTVMLPLKGALDIVRINHKAKTIQVADLKTSSDAHNFLQSILKYGYAFQQSFYNFLIECWVEANPQYSHYKVLPPINIVIDSSRVPLIFEYQWKDLNHEKFGTKSYLSRIAMYTNYPLKAKKGWMELLGEIAWHMHNDKWNMPKEMYLKKKIIVDLQIS